MHHQGVGGNSDGSYAATFRVSATFGTRMRPSYQSGPVQVLPGCFLGVFL
jgi:hypothetical protein